MADNLFTKERIPAITAGIPSSIPDDQRVRLSAEIAALSTLDLSGLRLRWRNETRRTAPAHLPKYLLLRMLAYRMQANVYGDLDAATVKMLDRVARQKQREAADRAAGVRRRAPRALKPGTVLVREWQGKLQRVMVLTNGFAWNGQTFASLSTVAKAITGTQWSGPRFFGLLSRKAMGASTEAPTDEEDVP
jgi:hypothetical protein